MRWKTKEKEMEQKLKQKEDEMKKRKEWGDKYNREKRWHEKEEMKEKEGWDEETTARKRWWKRDKMKRKNRQRKKERDERRGIIFHRGRVQWGSIIRRICGTCSDQCDDTNQREEKWWERRLNSQQLLQTHGTEAALQSNSTRGSLRLMKRVAMLLKTDAVQKFSAVQTQCNGEIYMGLCAKSSQWLLKGWTETRAAQCELWQNMWSSSRWA